MWSYRRAQINVQGSTSTTLVTKASWEIVQRWYRAGPRLDRARDASLGTNEVTIQWEEGTRTARNHSQFPPLFFSFFALFLSFLSDFFLLFFYFAQLEQIWILTNQISKMQLTIYFSFFSRVTRTQLATQIFLWVPKPDFAGVKKIVGIDMVQRRWLQQRFIWCSGYVYGYGDGSRDVYDWWWPKRDKNSKL